jgi:hypothetical protein
MMIGKDVWLRHESHATGVGMGRRDAEMMPASVHCPPYRSEFFISPRSVGWDLTTMTATELPVQGNAVAVRNRNVAQN